MVKPRVTDGINSTPVNYFGLTSITVSVIGEAVMSSVGCQVFILDVGCQMFVYLSDAVMPFGFIRLSWSSLSVVRYRGVDKRWHHGIMASWHHLGEMKVNINKYTVKRYDVGGLT